MPDPQHIHLHKIMMEPEEEELLSLGWEAQASIGSSRYQRNRLKLAAAAVLVVVVASLLIYVVSNQSGETPKSLDEEINPSIPSSSPPQSAGAGTASSTPAGGVATGGTLSPQPPGVLRIENLTNPLVASYCFRMEKVFSVPSFFWVREWRCMEMGWW